MLAGLYCLFVPLFPLNTLPPIRPQGLFIFSSQLSGPQGWGLTVRWVNLCSSKIISKSNTAVVS